MKATKARNYTGSNNGQVTLRPTKEMTPDVSWMLYAVVHNSMIVHRVLFYFPCIILTPLISSSLSMKGAHYQLYARDLKTFSTFGTEKEHKNFKVCRVWSKVQQNAMQNGCLSSQKKLHLSRCNRVRFCSARTEFHISTRGQFWVGIREIYGKLSQRCTFSMHFAASAYVFLHFCLCYCLITLGEVLQNHHL